MTEQNTEPPIAGYRYTPQGSLWMDEPTFWRTTPAAEWKKAAEVLYDLMPLAENVNQAMVIAVGDAQSRARVELERANERENSERDERGVSPGEHSRVVALIRRTDTLNNARFMIEDYVPEDRRGDVLSELEKLYREATDELNHYRRELDLDRAGY